ncbi:N-acetylmuramoyl-L-alanine amidase [Desulfocurvus sp. DL9XJH121]
MEQNTQSPVISRRKALLALGGACVAALTPLAVAARSARDAGLEAQALLDHGRPGEAGRLLAEAVRNAPGDPWLRGLLGRARLAVGDRAGALEAFRGAVALNPEDSYSRMMAARIAQTPLPARVARREAYPTDQERRAEAEGKRPAGAGGYSVRRVVLDPGHGGFDPGACGRGGLMEKDVALDVALRAQAVLSRTAPGLEVHLTRRGDYFLPLSARTAEANRFAADLFVSLHVNAGERRAARGVETYSCSERASGLEAERLAVQENAAAGLDPADAAGSPGLSLEEIVFRFERRRLWETSARAARRVQGALAGMLPMPDRGAHSADFYVLRRARMPALLLETGFISNPQDEAALKNADYRARVARAVAASVAALHGEGV